MVTTVKDVIAELVKYPADTEVTCNDWQFGDLPVEIMPIGEGEKIYLVIQAESA